MNLYSYLSALQRVGGGTAFPPMYMPRAGQFLDIGESGPPAATGVQPGPAYPNLAGEPTVIVNAPSAPGPGYGIPTPPSAPDWTYPRATALPSWLENAIQGGTNTAGIPANTSIPWQANAASPSSILQHTLNVLASNLAQQRNMNAFAQADWNRGMWTGNVHDPELSGNSSFWARLGFGPGPIGGGGAGRWHGRKA